MPAGVRAIAGVDDSKKLSPDERARLARLIWQKAESVSLGAASSREIDRINILRATTLAMRRALARLSSAPHHVVVDGREVVGLGMPHTAVVGGDGKCYAVACASIVAKVTRDRLMQRLAARYPQYGWEQNAGYATAAHLAAIDEHGATPHHRASFLVKQLELDLLA